MRTSLSLAALVAATAATAAPKEAPHDAKGEAQLSKIVEGRTAGKPVSCINLHDITSTEVIDHTAIVYHVGGGTMVYVNRPDIAADALNSDDILVTKTPSTQLCRIDTIRLVERTSFFERGFVGLGDFVPYIKVTPK